MKQHLIGALIAAVTAATAAGPAMAQRGGDRDWYRENPEPVVQRTPVREAALALAPGESVLSLAVSRLEPVAAVALSAGARSRLVLWDLRQPDRLSPLTLPDPGPDGAVSAVAFHPTKPLLYASVKVKDQWQLKELDMRTWRWGVSAVARSALPFGDLRVSPLPFTVDPGGPAHRLYFSVFQSGIGFGTGSVATTGHRYYRFFGAKPLPVAARSSAMDVREGDDRALPLVGDMAARPVSFHPQGTRMVLQDAKGCWIELAHVGDDWRSVSGQDATAVPSRLRQAFPKALACGAGEGEFLPNGLGWIHWRPGDPGVALTIGDATARLAGDLRFSSAPRLTADGAVLVGVTAGATVAAGGAQVLTLRARPVTIALADVVNAGLLNTDAELRLAARHDGLLTREPYEQMHLFYDVENYEVRAHADDPAYPYLVTTDLFWELFAAAYENLFTVSEDETAIPAFTEAMRGLRARVGDGTMPAGPLADKIRLAAALMDPDDNSDAVRKALADPEYQPRGNYQRSKLASRYFTAMRMLTFPKSEPKPGTGATSDAASGAEADEAAEWAKLPDTVRAPLRRWIGTYLPFIPGTRSETHLPVGASVPPYAKHPLAKKRLFPLSWGLDNEILDRVVLHTDREGRERVQRMLPSGLDVATVFGNALARSVLVGEFSKVANYQAQIDELSALYQAERASPALNEGLYNAWLQGLAVQWASRAPIPGTRGPALWDAKRLQTGLASWATLRHATLLVNDKSAAEGGEGGPTFEFLVRRPPRGSVEPDPDTFLAIAGLFERAQGVLETVSVDWRSRPAQALRDGVRQTLVESRDLVREFARMARSVRDGTPLSDEDAIDIQAVGGSMEHPYLVFKSAQTRRTSEKEPYGLSDPDPLPKVADVAGNAATGQTLLVGVGAVGGWQQAMPFNGLRQLSKGAIYTYRETVQPAPIDDQQWRLLEPKLPVPDWLRAYTAPPGTIASVPKAGR
ncbi:DUF3160 domain-containing protein [Roseateles sp.]|uniref:DUF3160 domain-containing protein n=1 Tax=Roseateles sp. TaxID=1971397 RepID=UPI002F423F4C